MKAIYILLLFLAIASCVNANTEILRFTTKNIAQLCTEEYEIASEHDVLDTASILTPPFTKLQAKIVPADDVQLYKLQNLTEGSSYELRISYPAITPADFTMRITQLCRLNRNVGSVEGLIKLTAVYTGISSIKDMDKNPVVYNLVLERLYLGFLFYQAYKIVIAIVTMIVVGYFVFVPFLKSFLTQQLKKLEQHESNKCH